jgi:hypothetical protein
MSMIPKKIDQQTASTIKSMLRELNINYSRVLIDFDKETVESQDNDHSIEDLLEAAGALSPERAKELLDEVNKSREEWD